MSGALASLRSLSVAYRADGRLATVLNSIETKLG